MENDSIVFVFRVRFKLHRAVKRIDLRIFCLVFLKKKKTVFFFCNSIRAATNDRIGKLDRKSNSLLSRDRNEFWTTFLLVCSRCRCFDLFDRNGKFENSKNKTVLRVHTNSVASKKRARELRVFFSVPIEN